MQDNKKRQSDAGNSIEKNRKKYIGAGLLAACAVVLLSGGALARYVASNRQKAEMQSASFHISSNYLEEAENTSYTVVDWGSGFDILLYNYEKENIAQVSKVDMTYTVTAENAQVTVKTSAGESAKEENGEYSFPAGSGSNGDYHTLHVMPKADIKMGEKIVITVETTSPYSKTLTAKFEVQNNTVPEYTIADQGNGTVLVTVKTNDYENTLTVTWNTEQFSPDNTNVNMTGWQDGTGTTQTETFDVNSHSTYELLFFKKTGLPYEVHTGNGMSITLE